MVDKITMPKIGHMRAGLFVFAQTYVLVMNLKGSLESWHTLLGVLGVTALFIAPEVLKAIGWIKK